ncbi:hypothetical protein [Herminiimonas sp. CN]|uniref:hypothetical protein n=1 Tax=Herminiimonas sp. CN TaxID=1349818 RepID=UPI00047429A8|nr:hypothetical protein [Herminiimonas sp. CN]
MATRSQTKQAAQSVDFTEALAAQPQPVHADTDSMEFSIKDFLAMAGVQLPGWKRVLLNFIACFTAGFAIGTVGQIIINILFTGAMTVTGSLFVAWVLYSVGFIIMLYAAIKAGAAISRYILGGKIDEHAACAKDKVAGWFSWGGKKEVQAA